MKVIIVVGSKHGSTTGIATAIGEALRTHGIDVSIAAVDDPSVDLAGYDAAVIGSAVYVGHWMKNARRFLDEHHSQLMAMPLWLFSSGPLGERPEEHDELADIGAQVTDLGARDHKVFAGNLDKEDLNIAERAAVRMVHAPYGDARDWDEIQTWATTIATELTKDTGPVAVSAPAAGSS